MSKRNENEIGKNKLQFYCQIFFDDKEFVQNIFKRN